MINKGDKQDQTFGDFMDKKDVDKEGGDNKQDDGEVNPTATKLDNNDDDN